MTTFPGKPPHEEAADSNWGSAGEEAEREAAAASRDDAAPVYGVGVPYGGNDRTEEVEPIALDMPFSPDEPVPPPVVPGSGAPVAGRRTPTPRTPPPLDAPAQLALSDLFDSTPPPSSLVPPDPAAFSTPPPGARGRWSREPGPGEPRAAEPPSPWTVSRPSSDAQYLGGQHLGGQHPAGQYPAGQYPGPSGAPGRAASPAGVPSEVAPPARSSSAPPPASARGAEPVATGGVVALPSINVLAESPRSDSRRASAPPAPERAELIDDFKATLPRPISLRAPGRPALLDDLQETAPRPIASRASVPPSSPAAAPPAEEARPVPDAFAPAGSERGLSSGVYLDEPDPTSKVFLDSLPEQVLADEDVAPLPSDPPPAVAPSPSSPQVAPQRSSPRASPSALALDDDLKATLQRPLPQGLAFAQEEIEPATQRRRESEPPARRSVPTLESVGNAAARALGSAVDEGVGPDQVVRLPSDVPTSRPPDVSLGAPQDAAPAERKSRAARQPVERRPSSAPQSVLAMLPSTKTQQLSLPSVMVADDVEAEHDSAAQRRALRAARQTVRIELPANFGRPGSALVPGLTPGTSTALPLPEPELVGRSSARRYAPWALAGLLLLAAMLLLVLRPRSGSLVVTALGAGHRAVASVQIFVDGKALCDSSPCRISGLSAGTHQLRATAPGLSSEELTVEIIAGEEAATNIELRSAEAPASERAPAAGEPRAARADKVVVTIQLSPESEGASVTLDDAFLLDFPAELELDPRTTHTLTATKPGYEDYTLQLELGNEAAKQIEVAMTPLEGVAPRPRARARPAAGSAQAGAARKSATPVSRPVSPQADATQGLLNISSTPPSQIILNGRPLGSTPKTAVVVPGDSLQTIVFVHPKMGRRRAQKFVPAGKERTVSIRF